MRQHTEAERAQWFSRVQEQEKSELPCNKFCEQNQLSLNTFTYYRSLYLKQRKPVEAIKSSFVELSITPTLSEPFRLTFPNGISLSLPQVFDQERLMKLMEVLRVC